MPFKSEKQRKWMWANEPEMAEKWEDEEDEKNEGKTVRVTNSQLRKIVRESLVRTLMLEQDIASALGTIIDTLDDKQKEDVIAGISAAGETSGTSGTEGTEELDPASLLDDPKALESAIGANPDMFKDFLGSNTGMLEDLLGGNPDMLKSIIEDPGLSSSIMDIFQGSDSLKGMLGSILPGGGDVAEGKTMRITKRQLRRIIKEETEITEGLFGDLAKKFLAMFDDPSKSGEADGYRYPAVAKYLKVSAEAETEEEFKAAKEIIKKNKKYAQNLVKELEGLLSERVLKRIIKEAVSLSKGLYAKESSYGGMFVEDSNGESISLGRMVLDLVDAGDTAFFNTGDGEDPESLENMLARHADGVQGGIERWDSDVFGEYYNVNNVKLVNRYAYQKKLTPIHWVGEDDELPSDAAWREQNTPPEPEYEDDGTNEFEERYS